LSDPIHPAVPDAATVNEPANDDVSRSKRDPHADKYNDPRVRFTWRSWLVLAAIGIGGVFFALLSVQARKTQLGRTTEFFGSETIQALQLGDKVMLAARGDQTFPPVELTAFPGLGHLRRALLDERHYDWETEQSLPISEMFTKVPDPVESLQGMEPADEKPKPRFVQLSFSDPTLKRFPPALIDVDLATGFVGPSDQPKRVQVNERVRPALRHQIELLMTVKLKRYDDRD